MGRYYTWQLRDRAIQGVDVSYEVAKRESEIHSGTPTGDDLVAIRGLGYAMHARMWLHSTTDVGMQTGKGSYELRIENARIFADKAGVPLYTIAETFGLEAQLPADELLRLQESRI